MPYRHDVHTRFERVLVRHTHEETRASGLVIPREISVTDIRLRTSDTPEGLVVQPTAEEVTFETFADSSKAYDLIETESIEDVVDPIVQIVKKLGGFASLNFGTLNRTDIENPMSDPDIARLYHVLRSRLDSEFSRPVTTDTPNTGFYL